MGVGERRGGAIARRVAVDGAMLLGMAALWLSFRYQTFLMAIYPQSLEVPLFGWNVAANSAYRVLTALFAFVLVCTWRPLEGLLAKRPGTRAGIIACGTLGIVLAYAVQVGRLGAGWGWVSLVVLNCSLLVACLSWASELVRVFGWRTVALMGASVPLSMLAPLGPEDSTVYMVFCAAIPLLMAGALFVVARCGWEGCGSRGEGAVAEGAGLVQAAGDEAGPARTSGADAGPVRALALSVSPVIWYLCLFLLIGSIVRGFADLGSGMSSDIGFVLAMTIPLVFAVACIVFARCGAARAVQVTGESLDRFVLLCWSALAVVLFAGLFLFLTPELVAVGGDVVVIVRSTLEVLLWIALCGSARRSGLPATPLFLVCFVMVEVVSWLLSYVVIPSMFSQAASTGVYMFTVTAVLFLLGGALVFLAFRSSGAFGGAGVAGGAAGDATGGAVDGLAGGAGAVSEAGLGADVLVVLEDRYGLTAREAQVALEFSDGYSLRKVAERLGIKQSTAQGYIREAYRKLGVTSKNELIDLIRVARETGSPHA